MPDKSIVATLLNGAIRIHRAGGDGAPAAPQEPVPDRLRLLRRTRGGIPGLANQFSREQILKFNYEDGPTLGERGEDAPAD